ncbi:MAG: FHA domain-containing serine/threonine-protein kinase [Myxococcota bacterium]
MFWRLMSDLSHQLAPGDRFQHYEVLDKLGEGAFATVHRVRADAAGPELELKLSHVSLGLGDAAKRATREVDVLRSLTNRHVVRIQAAGMARDGRVYIVMELLRGRPLDVEHDFDMPMPARDALLLVHQACMGLAEAHALGIVHRDLKPENLWVEPDGNLKVIDFGLARAWDESTAAGANVTMGQYLIGTPHYMQPEQLTSQRLTPAADVYSVATMLYELLSGHSVYFDDAPLSAVRQRYSNEPVPWMDAHANRPVIPLTRHTRVDVPDSVHELITRCLAKDPAARPADAGRLSAELGTILHYEYGVLPGAIVRVVFPYGAKDERLVLPGSHRIGSDASCELRLTGRGVEPVHALLEWNGPGDQPRLRALTDAGPVVVDGVRIHGAVQLTVDSQVQVGELAIEFVPGE